MFINQLSVFIENREGRLEQVLEALAQMGKSESVRGETFTLEEFARLSDLFRRQTGRIIVATFASNVYRLKHIIETAKRNHRKVFN